MARQPDRLFHFRGVHGELRQQIAQYGLGIYPFGREHVPACRRTRQRFHDRQSILSGDRIDVASHLHNVPVLGESPESNQHRQESDAQQGVGSG
jgi:hypothetical protein